MRKIKALLLDIDGTIFSSEEIIPSSYIREFERFHKERGRPKTIPTMAEIMPQIGKPVKAIFENLAPDLSDDERDELSKSILGDLVQSIENGNGEHYPGVKPTIERAARNGVKIFAASNGRRPYIEAILKRNETLPFFTEISVLDNINIKDKTELAIHILEKHKLDPAESALVGDRHSDRIAALESGCHYFACKYGHGSEEEWAGAAALLNSFSELLDYL